MKKQKTWTIVGFVVIILLLIALIVLASLVLTKVTKNNNNQEQIVNLPTTEQPANPTSSEQPVNPPTTERPKSCPASPVVWQDMACCRNSCPKGWGKRPVLLVSLDGFRADYLQQNKTPSIQRMINCGSHAPYMFPSYQSVTFPNHYTIVTGLYPESHGIVSNSMWDPTITNVSNQYFDLGAPSELDPQWWLGEPFWNTVVKNDLVAGTYFWPGSDVAIQNITPTYWYHYDQSVPFYQRIDTVIEWLLYPEDKRPQFTTLYFSEPDETGHNYGPYSPELSNELVVMDSFINYLMRRLFETDLMNCLDVILVADHGMELINQTEYMAAENYMNTKDKDVDIFTGPVGRIQIGTGSDQNADDIFDAMVCSNDLAEIYHRKEVPRRLHYSLNDRIGDIVVDMKDAFMFEKSNDTQLPLEIGDHGFDFKYKSMHALFVAFGPSFKENFIMTPFQNIELYNLFADLVNIPSNKRAPNNGTLGTLDAMLINPPDRTRPEFQDMGTCPFESATLQTCGNCGFLNQKSCQNSIVPVVVQPLNVNSTICGSTNCDYAMIYNANLSMPVVLQAEITYNSQLLTVDQNNCSTVSNMAACTVTNQSPGLTALNASMYSLLDFDAATSTASTLWYAKAPMYNGFYSGTWKWIQDVAMNYAKTYQSVILFSGPIFDYDYNGLADNLDVIMSHTINNIVLPTHYYQIMLRCDGTFNNDGVCQGNPYVLSFILPHIARPKNYCQTQESYLFKNTGRIRDIELLTGVEFFTNWDFGTAVRLRTQINDEFW